jgi:hypothetical protein
MLAALFSLSFDFVWKWHARVEDFFMSLGLKQLVMFFGQGSLFPRTFMLGAFVSGFLLTFELLRMFGWRLRPPNDTGNNP